MSSESPPAIDPQAWEDLRAMGGEDADSMVSELIALYLEDAAVLVASLESAHRVDDRQRLEQLAHALRSPSGSLGALALAEVCRQLEQQSASADRPQLDNLMSTLMEAYERVVDHLTRWEGQP